MCKKIIFKKISSEIEDQSGFRMFECMAGELRIVIRHTSEQVYKNGYCAWDGTKRVWFWRVRVFRGEEMIVDDEETSEAKARALAKKHLEKIAAH